MDPSAPRITIARTHPDDVRTRQIIVSADGTHVGELLFGQSVTTTTTPGKHRLRAHNTLFWKTLEVDLAPGEEARFVVINRAGKGTFSLLSLLGVGPLYLTFERDARP